MQALRFNVQTRLKIFFAHNFLQLDFQVVVQKQKMLKILCSITWKGPLRLRNYANFGSFILKRIVLILTTFTYLNLKLAFNLFVSFFNLLLYLREDWYAFISHLLYGISSSSNLVWSVNNKVSRKINIFVKNSISLNGFFMRNFFFLKKI